MDKYNRVLLIVLDGWGHREEKQHNAISEAQTPYYDSLLKTYPHTLLNASEEHVGLPGGTIGNSEIGHMTMGAGRVIDTDLVRISKAMATGGFNTNPAFASLFEHVKKHYSVLHVMGLVSDGGVHSHQEHLHGFLKAAKEQGITKLAIHVFTDGRDVPPQSAAGYLKQLEDLISDLGIGFIATASGRYFAMDRDKNWDRTDKSAAAIFEGRGEHHKGKKPSDVVAEKYKEGKIDEHLEPMVFFDDQGMGYKISDNDGVFFFNFRSDRPRQMSQKVVERSKKHNLYFVTMTQYHPALESQVAFAPAKAETNLPAEVSQAGLKQAHIAETEKYAHVTFFFNGGRNEPYPGETDFLIDSRKDVATHDQAPEMRAKEIADKALEQIDSADFIVMNFANADIVGHTANKPAIIKAVEIIDEQLSRIVPAALAKNFHVIITADHGNAEMNIDDKTGDKHTAHTLNLVPFILVSPIPSTPGSSPGQALHPIPYKNTLADIAPTIMKLMDLPQPPNMTGKSLV